MKKLLLSIAVVLMCISANAKVVLSEDFSGFASGSEAAPDPNVPSDLAGLTQTPGWTANYVCQAGGSAYLPAGATLLTPALDLSASGGNFAVSFKAKSSASPAIVIVSDMYMSSAQYVEITSEWKEYSITFNNGSAAYPVYFIALYNDFYIDDIAIDDMGVEIPVALPSTNFTKDSFTANWAPAGGATSYLLDVFTLEYDHATTTFNPVYLLQDKEVEGTSCVVTEGEFDVPYYYTVAAKNANGVSRESERITVAPVSSEVAAPVALDPTAIDAGKFTANWSASDIATKYYLSVAKVHTAAADEVYTLTDTDFSEFTEGTLDNPRKELEYLFDGDWSANMAVMAEGAIGINNQDIDFFGAGILASPMLQLSAGDGKVSVSFKAISRNGMQKATVELYNYDAAGNLSLGQWVEIALTEEWTEQNIVLENANGEASRIVFTSTEAGMMFIDDLKITMNLPAGASVAVPVRTYDVAGLSVEATDLNAAGDDKVYYYVVASWAVRQQEGVVRQIPEVKSAPSNIVLVELPTGIAAVEGADAAQVAVEGRTIKVIGAAEANVALYSVDGMSIAPCQANAAEITYNVASEGVYIVVAGNKIFKVAVK